MSPQSKIPYDPGDITILVVDDHPQIRKAMVKLLGKLKFEDLHESNNAAEAIQQLEELPVDLIVLDLYLGKSSGFEVLDYVRNREIASDIPVLVVTGEASKDEIVKAADLGANDYLVKPFQKGSFEEKVEKILSEYHLPNTQDRLFRKAERLYMNREYADTLVIVQEALSHNEESVKALYLKAITIDKFNDAAAAIALLEKAIEINENFYKAHAALAEIYIREGKTKEGTEAMLAELMLNPKQPRRQTQVATLLLQDGRIEDAINHFREALKENVKFRPALFGMGRAYANAGNIEKAVYYYKRVRRYYPTNTAALESIVGACLKAGDPKRAEHALKDEKNLHKDRADTYIVLGKFYLTQDEKEAALETVDELLTRHPDNLAGLKLKIAIYQNYGDVPEALELYKELLKKAPNFENALPYADLLISSQRYLRAVRLLHRVLKMPHNQKAVMARLAFCYMKTNQIGKAHFVYLNLIRKGLADAKIKENAQKCHNHLLTKRTAKSRVAS